ncbi:MAG: DUF4388 domain-containing protein [Thermoanaerobaculia bacterium]
MTRSSISSEAPEGRFRYRGDLAQTPLPEILYRVYHFRVPGVLEASRGDVVHRIYVRGGHVVHATSSDRDLSLGGYMRREGLLDEAQFEELMMQRETTSKRFGVLVLEQGLHAPDRIREAVQGQVEDIVWSLFGWDAGAVEFSLGEWEDEDVIQIQLSLRRVIVDGIVRELTARPLVLRLGGRKTVLEPCYRLEDLVEVGITQTEYDLLRLVNGESGLFELCMNGPLSTEENAKLLYAFQVLELVRPRVGASVEIESA